MLSINKGIWKSDILRSSITTNQHYLQQHQSQSPEFYTGCPIFPVRGNFPPFTIKAFSKP